MKFPALPRLWARDSRAPFSLLKFARRTCAVLFASVVGFAVVAVCGLAGLRFHEFVGKSNYFVIETLEVSGASANLEAQIRRVVTELRQKGQGNLALLRPGHIRFYVESLPRVRAVQIEKVYPRTLALRIEERLPLAVASLGGLYWLDREGHLLGEADPAEIAAARAPVITGLKVANPAAGGVIEQPMLAVALAAIQFLQDNDPMMSRRFAEWHLTDSGELTAILREGVEVRFGTQDPIRRMPSLVTAMQLKPDWEKFTYFDLRFDSQVVYF